MSFSSPWWLPGGHLQTIIPALFPPPRVPLRRERWDTPDGDFIDVDFAGDAGAARLLVLFHGLEGGSDSHYARALCAHGSQGFRVVCFDPHPYSTRGEARGIARLARQHGWRTVDVVTSRYHVFRAGMLIERCYHGRLRMIGASYPWSDVPIAWLSEWGKLLVQVTAERSC